MTKLDFIFQLQKKLTGLPQEDIDERMLFYSEMIDDRMDEGLTEEERRSCAERLAAAFEGMKGKLSFCTL